jgi:hypothetical protein
VRMTVDVDVGAGVGRGVGPAGALPPEPPHATRKTSTVSERALAIAATLKPSQRFCCRTSRARTHRIPWEDSVTLRATTEVRPRRSIQRRTAVTQIAPSLRISSRSMNPPRSCGHSRAPPCPACARAFGSSQGKMRLRDSRRAEVKLMMHPMFPDKAGHHFASTARDALAARGGVALAGWRSGRPASTPSLLVHTAVLIKPSSRRALPEWVRLPLLATPSTDPDVRKYRIRLLPQVLTSSRLEARARGAIDLSGGDALATRACVDCP